MFLDIPLMRLHCLYYKVCMLSMFFLLSSLLQCRDAMQGLAKNARQVLTTELYS